MNDPLMHLSGLGLVDWFHNDLSSVRGEIQGQTALAFMSSTFFCAQNFPDMEVIFYGDNKGVQQIVLISSPIDSGITSTKSGFLS
jgi:hypothetical protein